MYPLSHLSIDFNQLKVNLVSHQKSWDLKPINCVGVQTFEQSELKFTNV